MPDRSVTPGERRDRRSPDDGATPDTGPATAADASNDPGPAADAGPATAAEAGPATAADAGSATDIGASDDGEPRFGLTSETTGPGDRAGFRLAAFGALLIVVLFAGYGLGRLNNGTTSANAPTTATATATATNGTTTTGTGTGTGTTDESQPHVHNTDGTVTQGGATQPMGAVVSGLSLSSGGLTLVPVKSTFTAGRSERLEFRVQGAGGAAVTTYQVVHDKMLHLVLIRRDLSGFQHLHPTMAPDGTWGIDVTLAEPGSYRMIADFTAVVGGKPLATVLGSDLTVAGDYAPRPLPAVATTASTNGFTVGYQGELSTQSTQPIMVTVTGPDNRTAAVEPYLGAFGHLVVLREGDVAYVHVHPETQLIDGKVKFWLTLPSAGRYRMFFDFQVAGKVHTAAWTAQL